MKNKITEPYLILQLMLFSNYLRFIEKNKNFSSIIDEETLLKSLKYFDIDKQIITQIKKYIHDKFISFGQKFDLIVNTKSLEIIMIYDNSNLFIGFNETEIYFNTSKIIDTVKDISTFLDMRLKTINKKIKVHSGYYNILFYEDILSKIIKKIDTFNQENNIKNIYMFGFSAGGTLSTICSYFLTQKFKEINFILYPISYVKPGNKYFIKKLESIINLSIYPIINNKDIVPNLPPLNYYKNFTNNILLKKDFENISGDKINICEYNHLNEHYLNSYIIKYVNILEKNN